MLVVWPISVAEGGTILGRALKALDHGTCMGHALAIHTVIFYTAVLGTCKRSSNCCIGAHSPNAGPGRPSEVQEWKQWIKFRWPLAVQGLRWWSANPLPVHAGRGGPVQGWEGGKRDMETGCGPQKS